jgi:hypothetical protein
MSENRNRRTRDFSEYDVMSTEELKNILRLDSEAPAEQETDTELLLYIMGVLASRETNNTGKTALESWEDFQRNYLDEDEENIESTVEGIVPSKIHNHWMRRFVTVAAVLALIVSLAATASAIKWDALWNAVAHWANDTFSFVIEEQQETTGPSMQHELEYASLQEALKLNEQEYDFVPTWIPEGYLLEKVTVAKNPVQSVYLAQYKNGDFVVKVTVRVYPGSDPEKIEINDSLIEVYQNNGVDYYIFSNYEQHRAVWLEGTYECNISGELSIEELKMMIDSIGKG